MMLPRSIILGAALLMLSSAVPAGKTYQYEYQKIVNVEPTLELTINNANGNVVVTSNDENKLKVEAVKKIHADSKEEADMVSDHVQINVTAAEGHFTIEPQFLRIHDRSPSFWEKLLGKSGEPSYGSVDFIISVPVDCNADIYNSAGDIEVAGMRGKLGLSNAGGDVSARDILGEMDITTTSAKISLTDIEGTVRINATGSQISFFTVNGDLEIKNNSGKIIGEYLIGDLVMTKMVGGVDLKHVEGDIRIKSISGDISIGQDFGALDIANESGDITITTELNSPRDYYVETVSGSIKFMVPEDSSGKITMEVGSGNIDTRIPIAIDSFSKKRITGSFGSNGPKISLATQSGDIILAEF